jgi:hypothetical protein
LPASPGCCPGRADHRQPHRLEGATPTHPLPLPVRYSICAVCILHDRRAQIRTAQTQTLPCTIAVHRRFPALTVLGGRCVRQVGGGPGLLGLDGPFRAPLFVSPRWAASGTLRCWAGYPCAGIAGYRLLYLCDCVGGWACVLARINTWKHHQISYGTPRHAPHLIATASLRCTKGCLLMI